MTRHIGAFIQNTIKPLVEELDKLLAKCEHLNLDKETVKEMVRMVCSLELKKVLCYSFLYLILGILLCITIRFVLQY